MELGQYPRSERYGWLSDRYGVSWQVLPVTEMNELLSSRDGDAASRVMASLLAMKKIDLAELRDAAARA